MRLDAHVRHTPHAARRLPLLTKRQRQGGPRPSQRTRHVRDCLNVGEAQIKIINIRINLCSQWTDPEDVVAAEEIGEAVVVLAEVSF